MKKVLLFSLLICALNTKSQIKVVSGGNVGIGNLNPTDKLHVTGSTRLNGTTVFDNWTDIIVQWTGGYCCGIPLIVPQNDWYLQIGTPSRWAGLSYVSHMITKQSVSYVSDRNFKQNINYQLSDAYTGLLKLKPVSFNFKPSLLPGAPDALVKDFVARKRYGFIAQELMTVFPEMVEQDSSGFFYLNYNELIPLLTQGVIIQGNNANSLQRRFDSLSLVVGQCCQGNQQRLMSHNTNSVSNNGDSNQVPQKQNSYIKQNNPNPFSNETVIEYFLAEKSSNANILVFDMNGKLLKTIKVNDSGKGLVTISARDLQPGMYYYTLITNGIEVDTKKMILTE